MNQITIKIDGMMCGMCESHINDTIRKKFPVKKVTSSHSKGQTIILTDTPINEADLKAAIDETGYQFLSMETIPYQKKGLFGFKKRN